MLFNPSGIIRTHSTHSNSYIFFRIHSLLSNSRKYCKRKEWSHNFRAVLIPDSTLELWNGFCFVCYFQYNVVNADINCNYISHVGLQPGVHV